MKTERVICGKCSFHFNTIADPAKCPSCGANNRFPVQGVYFFIAFRDEFGHHCAVIVDESDDRRAILKAREAGLAPQGMPGVVIPLVDEIVPHPSWIMVALTEDEQRAIAADESCDLIRRERESAIQ